MLNRFLGSYYRKCGKYEYRNPVVYGRAPEKSGFLRFLFVTDAWVLKQAARNSIILGSFFMMFYAINVSMANDLALGPRHLRNKKPIEE